MTLVVSFRVLISLTAIVSAWLLHTKSKYWGPTIFTLFQVSHASLNAYFMKTHPDRITASRDGPEIFAASTIMLLLVSFLSMHPNFTVFLQCPIYIAYNISLVLG